MYIKKLLSKKNIYIFSVVFLIILIIVLQTITQKNTAIITPTNPITPVQKDFDSNPVQNTAEWNDALNKEFETFVKERNVVANNSLSEIRLNSPVDVFGNTIEYSYRTATYNITLLTPYTDNQNIVLSWFNQKGVTQEIIKSLRINWIQEK